MKHANANVRLLVWDAPDIDARLAEVAGVAPASAPAALDAVYLWLTQRCGPGQSAEACLFTLVAEGEEDAITPWVTQVRNSGFAVFAKPRRSGADSEGLAGEIAAGVNRYAAEGRLAEVVVASHNGDVFSGPLETLAAMGVPATVVGFREKAHFAALSRAIEFVDLEDVPGVFAEPLPRTNLFDLPSEGRTLPPLRFPQAAPQQPQPQAQPVAPRADSPAAAANAPSSGLAGRRLAPPPPPPAPVPAAAATAELIDLTGPQPAPPAPPAAVGAAASAGLATAGPTYAESASPALEDLLRSIRPGADRGRRANGVTS
ncbi:MAG: hypothetical protein ACKVWR_14070 [Acidimicrobiales bacterium]